MMMMILKAFVVLSYPRDFFLSFSSDDEISSFMLLMIVSVVFFLFFSSREELFFVRCRIKNTQRRVR